MFHSDDVSDAYCVLQQSAQASTLLPGVILPSRYRRDPAQEAFANLLCGLFHWKLDRIGYHRHKGLQPRPRRLSMASPVFVQGLE